MPSNWNPPELASLTRVLGMLVRSTVTHLIAFIRNQHIGKLHNSGHGAHIAKYPLAANVDNARGAENRPVCGEGGGTGKTGWVRECVGGFEAVAGEDGLYLAGAVEIAACVAGELIWFVIASACTDKYSPKSCVARSTLDWER